MALCSLRDRWHTLLSADRNLYKIACGASFEVRRTFRLRER